MWNYKDPPKWGNLIRIFPGIHQTRPTDFEDLAKQTEQFTTFFPLGVAVHRGLVTLVGHATIPARFQTLPLFKSPGALDEVRGRVLTWFLWDGVKAWPVESLSKSQRNLPIKELINMLMLIERIETGWTPADEVD